MDLGRWKGMTNEEAIKTLEANYPDACFEQLREAVDAAIEALTKEAWKEEHPVSPLLQSSKQDADDTISRKQAIDAILAVTGNSSVRELYEHVQEHGLSDMWSGGVNAAIDIIIAVPSAQPEPCKDADKLKRCKFEYINACKIVACPTPDTNKSDIYDAYAVIKSLHPIFGDEDF